MTDHTTRWISSQQVVFVVRGDQFVVLNSGEVQLDLAASLAAAVTSWNGRTGAVGGIQVDARGNADAASNLSAAAGEVRFTGANRIIGQRLAGGVRRGPV